VYKVLQDILGGQVGLDLKAFRVSRGSQDLKEPKEFKV
jgi:hypothetical protein